MAVERKSSGEVLLSMADSAARARPLRAWRTETLRTIRAALGDLTQSWNRDWGVPAGDGVAPDVDVATEMTAGSAVAGQNGWRMIAGTDIWWSFDGDGRRNGEAAKLARTALRAVLFGRVENGCAVPLPEPAPIEREVVDAAWRDWWRRLTVSLGEVLPVAVDEEVDRKVATLPGLRRWSGDTLVAIDWCGGVLRLRLDARHVALIAGEDGAARGVSGAAGSSLATRVPIEEAMATASCRIRADLGEVELSLGQLQELAVGDVIPLVHGLDVPATLRDFDGTPICGAWLGQFAGRVAVELTHRQHVADARAGTANR